MSQVVTSMLNDSMFFETIVPTNIRKLHRELALHLYLDAELLVCAVNVIDFDAARLCSIQPYQRLDHTL